MPRTTNAHSVRSQHARRMLWHAKETYPSGLLMRLRKEEGRLRLDWDAATTAEQRVAISGPLDRVRARILEVIGLPKRPGSPALKPRPMSAQGQIADAVLVSVDSNPEPIPAEPAESEE